MCKCISAYSDSSYHSREVFVCVCVCVCVCACGGGGGGGGEGVKGLSSGSVLARAWTLHPPPPPWTLHPVDTSPRGHFTPPPPPPWTLHPSSDLLFCSRGGWGGGGEGGYQCNILVRVCFTQLCQCVIHVCIVQCVRLARTFPRYGRDHSET